MNTLRQIIKYRHTLRLLVERELSAHYKGTMLGFFWLLIQPLIMVLVYSFVFSVIMKVRLVGIENEYQFALFLMAAMLPFFAFQESVIAASNVLFVNKALLQKSTLPAVLFPLVPILSTIITEIIALFIVTVAAYYLLNQMSVCLFFLPVVIFTRVLMSVAVGYVVATLAVFIQDLKQAIGLLLTMTLFITPVFYPVSMLPDNFLKINNFNPFYHLLSAYRSIIIEGSLPAEGFYWVILVALFALLGGVFFFNKTVERAKDFL